mmetsp:Transcript_12774/g.39427  ORF Transcript_12774/g.39427 Transcript_12774/m.39427 type:complete len:203 (+) Transcript_12774:79-687(+)
MLEAQRQRRADAVVADPGRPRLRQHEGRPEALRGRQRRVRARRAAEDDEAARVLDERVVEARLRQLGALAPDVRGRVVDRDRRRQLARRVLPAHDPELAFVRAARGVVLLVGHLGARLPRIAPEVVDLQRAARPPVLRVAVPPQTAREVQFFGEDRVREVRDEVRRALELRPIGAGGAREALRRLDAARGAALVDAPAAHYY